MPDEKKTITRKLRKTANHLQIIATWFEDYKKWREQFLAKDEGGNPGGPPPPPPPGDEDGE